MSNRHWRIGIGALAAGLLVMAGGVRAQEKKELPGPIDSVEDLQSTGKMLFKMADVNNDGQISQKEATDVGNLLVGGFFFRADANGDGVVSREEAQQARDMLLRQKPILRIALERASQRRSAQPGQPAEAGQRNAQVQNSMRGIMTLIDANNDGQLQATEVRQTVQTGVQGVFASADTNRDGQLSPGELNAAVVAMVQAAGQASFQVADKDGNGALSLEEFDQSIIEPAHTVFRIIDANGDNQLSQQEVQAAQRTIASQLRMFNMPESSGALGRRIGNTSQPGSAPAFGSPTSPARTTPAAPPQPRRPAPPASPAPGEAPQ